MLMLLLLLLLLQLLQITTMWRSGRAKAFPCNLSRHADERSRRTVCTERTTQRRTFAALRCVASSRVTSRVMSRHVASRLVTSRHVTTRHVASGCVPSHNVALCRSASPHADVIPSASGYGD